MKMNIISVVAFLLLSQNEVLAFEPLPFHPPPILFEPPMFFERIGRVMFEAVNEFKSVYEKEVKKLNCSKGDSENRQSSPDATFTFNLKDNCMDFVIGGQRVYKHCSRQSVRLMDPDNFIPAHSHFQPVQLPVPLPFGPIERLDWDRPQFGEFPLIDLPFMSNEINEDLIQLPPFMERTRHPLPPIGSWKMEKHEPPVFVENVKNGWLRDLLFRRTSSSPPENYLFQHQYRHQQQDRFPPVRNDLFVK